MHAATFESTQYRDFGELRKPESEKRGSTGKKLHALDSGDTAQYRQALRRERTQGTPRAFELVDPGDEAQDLGGDLEGVGSQHKPMLRPFTPIRIQCGVIWPLWIVGLRTFRF